MEEPEKVEPAPAATGSETQPALCACGAVYMPGGKYCATCDRRPRS